MGNLLALSGVGGGTTVRLLLSSAAPCGSVSESSFLGLPGFNLLLQFSGCWQAEKCTQVLAGFYLDMP